MQIEYKKDAKRDMVEIAGLPVDIPDNVRSKLAAQQLSDVSINLILDVFC